MLVELNGSLHHLTCLQVLLLNGNQLVKLTDIVHELKAMQCLKTLSKLSDNFNPIHSKIKMHLPQTYLYIFPVALSGRIGLTIKGFLG